MTPLLEIARRHGLTIIEDAAHAIGAEYQGRPVGSLGHFTCFSLYATKNITTGEGGFLTTDDAAAADYISSLALHGLSNTAWRRYGERSYHHAMISAPGFNYVMFDLQAALGLCQLGKIEEFWLRRQALAEAYDAALAGMDEISALGRHPDVKHAYHLYVILLRQKRLTANRDTILDALQAEGIGAGIHFTAVHLHPYYRRAFPHCAGQLPNAEYASERVISLPLYPGMTAKDQDDVVAAVIKVIRHYRKRPGAHTARKLHEREWAAGTRR